MLFLLKNNLNQFSFQWCFIWVIFIMWLVNSYYFKCVSFSLKLRNYRNSNMKQVRNVVVSMISRVFNASKFLNSNLIWMLPRKMVLHYGSFKKSSVEIRNLCWLNGNVFHLDVFNFWREYNKFALDFVETTLIVVSKQIIINKKNDNHEP